jgi:hypothetical protein
VARSGEPAGCTDVQEGAGSDRAYAGQDRLYSKAPNAAHRPLASELKHVLSVVGTFVHSM